MKGAKVFPLTPITLHTRPLARRALAWSCDAELAVAADDSVHVLVPEFPDPHNEGNTISRPGAANGGAASGSAPISTPGEPRWAVVNKARHGDAQAEGSDGESGSDSEGGVSGDESGWKAGLVMGLEQQREQFSRGRKHFPVSYPPVDPRVNRELFEAAGEPFPYDQIVGNEGLEPSRDGYDDGGDAPSSDEEMVNDDDATGMRDDENATPEDLDAINIPAGAGRGPISGVGATMNHVVALEWSPSGVGRNRRPVLAVLTASGVLAVYGDGPAETSLRSLDDGQQRSLDSWVLLWAVGERLFVPGQDPAVAEYIRSFAWSREIGPGRALLAYVNDQNEIAVLSIQSRWNTVRDEAGGQREKMRWRVQEIARSKAAGPHPTLNPYDADFTPSGSAYCLRWSPWITPSGSLSCLLAYVDHNYVGFRNIRIIGEWKGDDLPDVTVDNTDSDGRCIFMSTDAFVEWEDAIWTIGGSKVCRGVVATPYHVKTFEVALEGPDSGYRVEPHGAIACGTAYPNVDEDPESTNPIIGLVIHLPNLSGQSDAPVYTLARHSATSTNDDWYQTNAPFEDNLVATSLTGNGRSNSILPQWAVDIQGKLDLRVPASFEKHLATDSSDSSDANSSSFSDDDASDGPSDADLDAAPLEWQEATEEGDLTTVSEEMIHPHRFLLHGLAASPGGGASAVLASMFSTQTPDRSGWYALRSTVYFAAKPRTRTKLPSREKDLGVEGGRYRLARLTTEGRMWEWMYGGGVSVPGVATAGKAREKEDVDAARRGALVHQAFDEVPGARDCDVCEVPLVVDKQGREGRCPKGHVFDICAASGLAIQEPGISRTCGVCGSRCMKVDELVKLAPQNEDLIRGVVSGDVCDGCGGKFLD